MTKDGVGLDGDFNVDRSKGSMIIQDVPEIEYITAENEIDYSPPEVLCTTAEY